MMDDGRNVFDDDRGCRHSGLDRQHPCRSRRLADGRVFDAYRWLRRHNPVGRASPEGFAPFWVVTRLADILQVSQRNDIFSNAAGQLVFMSEESDRRIRAATGGSPHVGKSLIQIDGDEHRTYRRLMQAWFMPRMLRNTEEHMRSLARQTTDRLLATGGRCDVVTDIASHYPLRVILELIGVPPEDFLRLIATDLRAAGPGCAGRRGRE